MALKTIRLLWGTPPITGGQWRLHLFHVQRLNQRNQPLPATGLPGYWKAYLHTIISLNLRGVIGWTLSITLVVYFFGAFVLLQRIRANDPNSRVAYLDLADPARWENLPKLRSESLIATANERLEEQSYGDALSLLRAGLAGSPGNFEARLLLAQMYGSFRLFHLARRTATEGCELGYPGRPYLEFAFSLAADADQPESWIALCQTARTRYDALPPNAKSAKDGQWLIRQYIEALIAAERHQEALDSIPLAFDPEETDGRLATIRCQLALKNFEAARETALRWTQRSPADPEAWRTLALTQRETRDLAGMDDALVHLRACEGPTPPTLLFALRQAYLAEQPETARTLVREYLFRHGSFPESYSPLAAVIAEVGAPEDLRILEQELAALGYSPESVRWARLEIAMKIREWPEALRQADLLLAANQDHRLGDAQREWLGTATLLARACDDAGPGLQSTLIANVVDHPGTLRLYKRLLDALLDAGRLETAARILTLAEGPYPDSRTITAYRSRIASLAAAAAPAPPIAGNDMTPALASFSAFAESLNGRLAASDPTSALALIAAARRANPSWQSSASTRLDEWELPLRARSNDPLILQMLVRTRLPRDPASPTELLALAIAVHGEGHRENAVLILKEILRHAPDDASALTQLAVWQPPVSQPGTPSDGEVNTAPSSTR